MVAVAVAVAANGLGGFFVCVEGGRRGLCIYVMLWTWTEWIFSGGGKAGGRKQGGKGGGEEEWKQGGKGRGKEAGFLNLGFFL